jgi:hypothetical protein
MYIFGTSGGGMAQIFDIENASTGATPVAAPDIAPTPFPTGLTDINEVVRNVQVFSTGGFAMSIWAANATGSYLHYPGSSTANALYEIYPSYGMLYTHIIDLPVGSTFLSLVSYRINREIASPKPFTASARYYNNIPSVPEPVPTPTPAPVGPVNGDGTIIWVPPSP